MRYVKSYSGSQSEDEPNVFCFYPISKYFCTQCIRTSIDIDIKSCTPLFSQRSSDLLLFRSVGRSKRQCAKMFCFACVRMYWRIFLDFYCRCSILFWACVCVSVCWCVCNFKEEKKAFNASIVQTEKDVWFHFIPHSTGTNINVKKYNELNKKNKQHSSLTLAKKQFLHVLRFLFPPETSDVTAQHSLIQLFFAVLRLLHTFVHFFFVSSWLFWRTIEKFIYFIIRESTIRQSKDCRPNRIFWLFKSHFAIDTIHLMMMCTKKHSTFATIWNYQSNVFPQFVLTKISICSVVWCVSVCVIVWV